jgi:hypothetical protein
MITCARSSLVINQGILFSTHVLRQGRIASLTFPGAEGSEWSQNTTFCHFEAKHLHEKHV